MSRSLALAATLVALSSAHVQAQRPAQVSETAAMYAAILQDMPPFPAGQSISVDPRPSESLTRGDSSLLDVWERHLSRTEAAPAAAQLQRLAGIKFCTETTTRSSCLLTAADVHVTFSDPVVEDSAVSVDATFARRTSDEHDVFDIQTWRYSFVASPEGPVLQGREFKGRGHGRIGNN